MSPKILSAAALAAALAVGGLAIHASQPTRAVAVDQTATAPSHRTFFRSEKIDGVNVAYREAGDPAKPTVLLLHGFPTSSHMFRNLIPKLAKQYHVLAPDYPGFGASDMPKVTEFDYTFDRFATMMTELINRKGVKNYAMYVMDYGAPVGYRMFAAEPERVSALIIQNGNAYEEGLREFWDPIRAYWADPSKANGDKLRGFLKLDGTKWQYLTGVKRPELISPDNFWHVQYLLDRPGNQDIQLKLFLDYGTNPARYPKWQALLRKHQPPTLLMWGKNDPIFPEEGAYPYKRDLKDLEFHLLDTGHFALEEYNDLIAARMLALLDKVSR